jgi:hypothetical protein
MDHQRFREKWDVKDHREKSKKINGNINAYIPIQRLTQTQHQHPILKHHVP